MTPGRARFFCPEPRRATVPKSSRNSGVSTPEVRKWVVPSTREIGFRVPTQSRNHSRCPARSNGQSLMTGPFSLEGTRTVNDRFPDPRSLLDCWWEGLFSPLISLLSRSYKDANADRRNFRVRPFNRPISAHSQGVRSLRASVAILVRRLESRSRQLRAAPIGRPRRNISSAC